MTSPALIPAACAWCGEAVPAKRRGRPGRRRFCQPECKRAFQRAAREIGAAYLTAQPAPGAIVLKDWRTRA